MEGIDNSVILSLVKRIKNKDENAFREFFYLLQPSIFYFLFRFTSDTNAAEDLTQETFIKFWEFIDKVDISLSPKSYLYKIAKNLALNFVTRKPPIGSIDENESALNRLSNSSQTNHDSIFLNDEYHKAINTLPERCRLVFILSRFDGFNYSEIAEVLGISLQTVKNQMNKALSILRKKLASHLN
jgi:RNA polymerase sigma-70 factor (ECF subfamily)